MGLLSPLSQSHAELSGSHTVPWTVGTPGSVRVLVE